MLVEENKDCLKNILDSFRSKNQLIGFVPTMGALHKGHISLIEKAKKECDIVVCSIFINPTQFNNKKDLAIYPSNISRYKKMLSDANCDILFLPNVNTMYPDELVSKKYLLEGLDSDFEGKKRPGHFDGVCTIVHQFFNLIRPNKAYFGQKDFQQLTIIKHLVKIQKLNIEIVACPIIRESNGLAKSSRNVHLSESAFQNCSAIYESLKHAKVLFHEERINEIIPTITSMLKKIPNSKIEYINLAYTESLKKVDKIDPNLAMVLLVAIKVENVRLLDNILLKD